LPGPWFVTVNVHVIVPFGLTIAGPVFAIPRSVGGGMHVVPSLNAGVDGPAYDETTENVGVPAGFVIESW
jgi:hypothetical protein